MNFERKSDAKETIGIGLRANAPIINNFFVLETDILDRCLDGPGPRSPVILDDPKRIWQILEMVAEGKIPPCDFCFDVEGPDYGVSSRLIFLDECRGKYVRYIAHSMSPSFYAEDFIGTEGFFLIPGKNDV